MAIFLYCFILLSLFFVRTSAYIQCDNDRACPDGYECDLNTNGTFCCFNSSCDSVRSSWSLLSSNCLHQPGYFCRANQYCPKYGKYCIRKEIAVCDNYLEMESNVKCGSDGYLIQRGFERCNELHRNIYYFGHPKKAVMMCTEECIQQEIATSIFEGERDCDLISEQAFSNYSRCFASCGGCILQESWDLIFDYFSTERMQDVAKRCALKFREASGEECPLLTRRRAESFIQKTKENADINVSEFFAEFIGTTTVPSIIETENTISQTSTFESTVPDIVETEHTISQTITPESTVPSIIETEHTTFYTSTLESTNSQISTLEPSNFKPPANEIDSSNVCEFRNGQFQLTCVQLILLGFVMSILNLAVLLSVYKFSSRTYKYKPDHGQSYEMNSIGNGRH